MNALFRTLRLLAALIGLGGGLLHSQGAPAVTPLRAYRDGIVAPARIATDAGGRVYVTDSTSGLVQVWDESGTVLPGKTGLDRPLGVAVDASGRIYVAEEGNGSVSLFLPDWSFLRKLGQGNGEFLLPNHLVLAPGPDGLVYVGDSRANVIKAFSQDGTRVFQFGSPGTSLGQFDFPTGLHVNAVGEVFVADQNNGRIQVFSSDGVYLRTFGKGSGMFGGSSYGRIQGLTGDAASRLFIADTVLGIVRVVDFTGRAISTIGSFGEGFGQLQAPMSLCIDRNNRLFVASVGNSRVDAFGLDTYTDPNALQLAPSDLIYATNPALYAPGHVITPNLPSHSGGVVATYSVSPALPAGLALDSRTGVISGSALGTAPTALYTITASNSKGSTSADLTLSVRELPPSSLTYTSVVVTYTQGLPISPNTPSYAGSEAMGFVVSPDLPTGLSLNPMTGVITGVPTTLAPIDSYFVTASNSEGSTSVELRIAIKEQPPRALVFATNPAIYLRESSISPNVPSCAGGAVTSYTVSPVLPDGLSLDPATGILTGTPTANSPLTVYTITASNAEGSTSVGLSITVVGLAPTGLTYSTNPAIYGLGSTIPPNTPTHGGGEVSSYTVSPPLPTGLYLNSVTGIITGSPTTQKATATYTVTASNAEGSATSALSITIKGNAPAGLTYPTNPAIYVRGLPISPNIPTQSGGAVTAYTVAPPLPSGLYLDSRTGRITGNPIALTPQTLYRVTASNVDGSTTSDLWMTVKDLPPSDLAYSTTPALYFRGFSIVPNTPTLGGGLVMSYTVTPALPQGLHLDSRKGLITGKPLVIKAPTLYRITASNTAGSASVDLSITVKDIVPSALVYPVNPAVYVRGAKITPNSPTHGGGQVTAYSILPALPQGLYLDSTTGTLTGTPLVPWPATLYTITASNSEGSTTVDLSITVNGSAQ